MVLNYYFAIIDGNMEVCGDVLSPLFNSERAAVKHLKSHFNNDDVGGIVFKDEDVEDLFSEEELEELSGSSNYDEKAKVQHNELNSKDSWWKLNTNHQTLVDCSEFLHDIFQDKESFSVIFDFHIHDEPNKRLKKTKNGNL